MNGSFADTEREQFKRLLDYYGQDPIIVRSSSILEDGFGNAFAGKYESVFCSNYGSMEKRLEGFEQAVRTVYASTMSKSALDYRIRRGLQNRDEQMGLLVQRVSGSRYEGFFMPCAAGVGYSYSPYRFLKTLDPHAGMLRLVMGLGTGAVDRTQGSYPRLVSLDQPTATAASTSAEKHQFSQRKIDVIQLEKNEVEHRDLSTIEGKIPYFLKQVLLEHDFDAESMFRNRGQNREVLFVSCQGLVKKTELMDMMKDILALIQREYEYPVDIEYTINISETGEFVVNLLQCRPLQVAKNTEDVTIPETVLESQIFLDCCHASMGLSQVFKLDYIVMVDPIAYYNMEYSRKYEVAKLLGSINWYFRKKDKHLMLMVPGRIGTTSPELGVPTSFAEVSEFDIICEISENQAGYMPELSYGSHFFQDLVEAEILYCAIFRDETTNIYAPEKLQALDNKLPELFPEAECLASVLALYCLEDKNAFIYHDMNSERILGTLDPT